MTAACPPRHPDRELLIRIERLELTLEYIASAASAYSLDEIEGRRFASIRDTALEMIGDRIAESEHLGEEDNDTSRLQRSATA